MQNQMKNTQRSKTRSKQFFWDEELKQRFERLIGLYDPTLTANKAIKKLVIFAVETNWLPGYIPIVMPAEPVRKEVPTVIRNKMAEAFDKLKK